MQNDRILVFFILYFKSCFSFSKEISDQYIKIFLKESSHDKFTKIYFVILVSFRNI